MIYKIVRIDEDIDFGCEERAADEPVMAIVVLEDENGSELRLRVADQVLYDKDMNEGDQVMICENGSLEKYVS